jgi:hypothetical protein
MRSSNNIRDIYQMISKSSIDLEEERQMQIGRRKHKRHIVCLLEFDSTNKHIESTKWG